MCGAASIPGAARQILGGSTRREDPTRINLEKLLSELASAEAPERMAAIRILQEALSEGPPEVTPAIMHSLERIASSDDNPFLRTEASRLLARDEYLDLYRRLDMPPPAASSIQLAESAPTTSSPQVPAHAGTPVPETELMPFLGCYRLTYGLGALLPAFGVYYAIVNAHISSCIAIPAAILVYLVCSFLISRALALVGYR